MCEPLSVAVHACRRAGNLIGSHVVIFGAGPIGLVTLMVAKAFGASHVLVTDVDESRVEFAKKMGADVVFAARNFHESDQITAIRKVMNGKVDFSFDCVGVTQSMRVALAVTNSGGKVLLVGMGHTEMQVPLTSASAREVDIIGVFRYLNTYPLCIDLIKSKKVDVMSLITHRFGFNQEDVIKAFDISSKGGSAIKVMFNLNE